jgi:hypothetical protein
MTRAFDHSRRRAAIGLAAIVAAVFAHGCGGGGGDGTPSGGTGSFAVGPIGGLGSIVVNGIRYDDASAQVRDADDALVSRDSLALGMVVEVSGSSLALVDGVRSGTATTIRYASEVVGPVTAVDPAAGTLSVLGRPVRVDAATVWAPAPLSSLSGLRVGDVVEVHGLSGGTPGVALRATRIELEPLADRYQLRGVVSAADPATRTFRVAGVLVDATSFATLPENGRTVRLRLLQTPRPGDGAYRVDSLRIADRRFDDREEVEIEGLITAWESPARFSVDGIPVDASRTTVPPAIAAAPLGRRIEVEGRLSGGVLIAREVELEEKDDDGGGGASVTGPIASVDGASRTFVVRGRTVRWDGATRFDDGTAAGLRVGVVVEVDGIAQPDGSLRATEIEFDD